MEPPATLEAQDLQAARGEAIGCFRRLDPKEVVLGQFDGCREVTQATAPGPQYGI